MSGCCACSPPRRLPTSWRRSPRAGARLTFPGWSTETERKNGSIKVDYMETHKPGHKAREYLEGATTAGEVAGRALALLAAARWADEHAVAKSRRSFYELRFERTLGVPWSAQAGELLDELLIERLSPEATAPIREAKHKRETARAEAAASRGRARPCSHRLGRASIDARRMPSVRPRSTACVASTDSRRSTAPPQDAINAHPEPATSGRPPLRPATGR